MSRLLQVENGIKEFKEIFFKAWEIRLCVSFLRL